MHPALLVPYIPQHQHHTSTNHQRTHTNVPIPTTTQHHTNKHLHTFNRTIPPPHLITTHTQTLGPNHSSHVSVPISSTTSMRVDCVNRIQSPITKCHYYTPLDKYNIDRTSSEATNEIIMISNFIRGYK